MARNPAATTFCRTIMVLLGQLGIDANSARGNGKVLGSLTAGAYC
jgi:hypothetical protein